MGYKDNKYVGNKHIFGLKSPKAFQVVDPVNASTTKGNVLHTCGNRVELQQ